MSRSRFSSGTRRTALCGVLIGFSTVLLYLAGFLPTAKVGVAALAGLFPTVAVIAAGKSAGFLCWAGSGVLGLLLAPEKWLALLYVCFLGLYPVVKSIFESWKSRIAEWLCKLFYFNAVLLLFWTVLRALVMPGLPELLQQSWALVLICNLIFVIYDVGLSRLIAVYCARIAPAIGLKR